MNKKKQELIGKIKGSQSQVMDAFDKDHKIDICFFCGSSNSLTKEHVIPQWVFEEKKNKAFLTPRLMINLKSMFKLLYLHVNGVIMYC